MKLLLISKFGDFLVVDYFVELDNFEKVLVHLFDDYDFVESDN